MQQEEQTKEEQSVGPDSNITFWDKVNWDIIKHNKITRDDFLKIKLKNRKSYATLLGSSQDLNFFMFKALMWPEYKEMKMSGDSMNESASNLFRKSNAEKIFESMRDQAFLEQVARQNPIGIKD